MENNTNKDNEIELLKLEYQQCQSGYNSRDGLAEDEFCKVIQKFSVFLTILLAFNIFIKISPAFHFLVCVIIGVAGFCCLFSLLVVIESNSGCNLVLRQRCRQIEDRLKELTGFQIQYWQEIEKRHKYPEERMVKGIWGARPDRERREQERNIFVNTVRLLMGLWIIIVVAMIIWGGRITIKDLGGNESPASKPPAKVSSYIDHRQERRTFDAQPAKNAANTGDIIELQQVTYTGIGNRDIDFLGKAITVRSTNPQDPCVVASTVINCQKAGRGFYFHSGEDANSVLDGFTITAGNANPHGFCYPHPKTPYALVNSSQPGFEGLKL